MEYSFEGKNILVTGAGHGIGRGIALSLAAAGANVYALDRDKEILDDLLKETPTIIAIHQDLKDWYQTRETVSKIEDLHGLVNCAAILGHGTAAVEETKEDIDQFIDVNLKAAINLMQVVGKMMIQSERGGSIVNITSQGAKVAMENHMAYCVSKAGLNMATKVFALELGPYKIRVNSLAPTATNTKMFEKFIGDREFNRTRSKIPMGRYLEADDVAPSVIFLLSDKSKMITGTTVTVDGGHTCYLPA